MKIRNQCNQRNQFNPVLEKILCPGKTQKAVPFNGTAFQYY